MRFCQTDGTPLVEDAPPADPYKTMVASKEDIQAALNAQDVEDKPSPAFKPPEDEPLEIPSTPPKPMPASELKTKLAGRDEAQVIEIPPLAESEPPEPPRFSEPTTPPPSFDQSTPASPFSSQAPGAGDFQTTPPIPSPFSEPKSTPFGSREVSNEPEPEKEKERTYFEPEPAPQSYSEPAASIPQYAEPEPAPAQQFNPFDNQSSSPGGAVAQSEWAPPSPAEGGQGMSSPLPPVTGGKVNQVLPIVSLITGILSLCCWISPLTGIIALITGFLGIKNVNNDPAHYGGKTLAIVGMILGALFFVVGLAYWVFVIFFNGAALLMQLANQGR